MRGRRRIDVRIDVRVDARGRRAAFARDALEHPGDVELEPSRDPGRVEVGRRATRVVARGIRRGVRLVPRARRAEPVEKSSRLRLDAVRAVHDQARVADEPGVHGVAGEGDVDRGHVERLASHVLRRHAGEALLDAYRLGREQGRRQRLPAAEPQLAAHGDAGRLAKGRARLGALQRGVPRASRGDALGDGPRSRGREGRSSSRGDVLRSRGRDEGCDEGKRETRDARSHGTCVGERGVCRVRRGVCARVAPRELKRRESSSFHGAHEDDRRTWERRSVIYISLR